MDEMWWRAEPHDLHRVTDRVSTLYVERTHVDRNDNALILINKERTVQVPAVLLAVVLLGPGTRVTHAAMNLLGDSGTAVCWVGEHGVRLYAAGLGPSRGAHFLRRQAYLVSRRDERIGVARRMYGMRFPADDVSGATMQQLRGREGTRVKRIYRAHAERTGVQWTGRKYVRGEPNAAGDDVNRALSMANSCLYGICHAGIVGIGASPGLGFVHTGSAISFVLDIADLYKAEFTIPLAFDLTAGGWTKESDIRSAFREKLVDGKLLARIVHDVRDLLREDETESTDHDSLLLWDEKAGDVSGGKNWAGEGAEFGDHIVVDGSPGTAEPVEGVAGEATEP